MPLDFKKKRRDGSTAPSRKPSRPPAQDTHARRSSNERHGSITRGFSKDGRRSSTGKSADGLYPSAAPKPIMKGSGRRPKSGRRARNLTEEVATHRLQRWWRTSRILSALSAGLYLRTLEQIHHDERLAVVRAHLAKQVLGRFFNSLANQKANRELRRQDRDQNRSLPLIAAFMMARSASKEVTQRRAAKYKDAVAVIEDYWRRSALFIRVQSMSTNERAQRIFCQQEHIERRELFRQRLLFLIERHQEFFNAAIMREATLGTRMIPSTVRSVILFSKGFIDGDDGVFEVDERKVCGTGSYHPYYGLERRGDVDAIKQLERHIFFSAEERHLLAEERIFSTGRAVGPGFARGKVSRAMRHPQVYRFIYNYRSVLESVEERASPILSGGRRTPKVPISEGARALSQLQKDLQPPTLRRDPAVLLKLMEEQGSVLVPHIVGASFVAESRRQEGYLPSSSSLPMEEEEEPSPSSPARATMHTESIYSLTSTSLPGKPHQSLIVSKYSECASSFQEYLGTMCCRGLRQLNRLSTGTSVSSDHVELVLRSCTDPIQKMFFDPLGRLAADGSAAAVSLSGTGAGDATNAPSATVSARSTAGDGSSIKPPWSSKHTISASLLGPHWMHFYQKHYDSFLAMEREPPAEKSQPRCVSSRTALDGAKSFSPCPRDTASPMGVSRRMSLFSTEQQVGGAEVPTHRQKERLSMVLGNPTTRRTFTLQSLARDASRREDVGYSRRMLSPSMADDDELGGVAGLRPDAVSPAYLLPRLSMAPPNKSSLFSGSHYELRQEDTMYEFHLAYNVERLLAQENVIRISIRRGWRSQWVSLQKLSLINQREIEHELSTRY